MPPRLRVKPSEHLRRFVAAGKYETRVISQVERMLLARGPDDTRDTKKLHPSEVCKPDWCQRASYYRIAGEPETVVSAPAFILEAIWEEGHGYHHKWQGWINDLGMLRGRWECAHCHHEWHATSPKLCPDCGSEAVKYREVPIHGPSHLLIGHADADLDEGHDDIADDPLVEIKSIGLGTLRMEVPHLLAKYTHKVEIDGQVKTWTDVEKLWREIRRPFPSHMRQGQLYLFMSGRKEIVFIYEYKPTSATKEFVVKYSPKLIEDILDGCLDVQWALEQRKPPVRPLWATSDHKTCSKCPFGQSCWDQPGAQDDGERRAEAETGSNGGPARSRRRRTTASSEAVVRPPEGAGAVGRPDGPGPDEAVREPLQMGRLRQRPTSPGSDQRETRRGAARYRRGDGPRP